MRAQTESLALRAQTELSRLFGYGQRRYRPEPSPERDVATLIRDFYRIHNPPKVARIESVLASSARPDGLCRALLKKYKPSDAQIFVHDGINFVDQLNAVLRKIVMYTKDDRAANTDIDQTLRSWIGREMQRLKYLQEKCREFESESIAAALTKHAIQNDDGDHVKRSPEYWIALGAELLGTARRERLGSECVPYLTLRSSTLDRRAVRKYVENMEEIDIRLRFRADQIRRRTDALRKRCERRVDAREDSLKRWTRCNDEITRETTDIRNSLHSCAKKLEGLVIKVKELEIRLTETENRKADVVLRQNLQRELETWREGHPSV